MSGSFVLLPTTRLKDAMPVFFDQNYFNLTFNYT